MKDVRSGLHGRSGLLLVVKIDTGQQPKLTDFSILEVIEIDDFDLELLLRGNFGRAINESDGKSIFVSNDVFDVKDRVSAMAAIPSQSIDYIIVAERLRAMMSDNIFMVKSWKLLQIKRFPDISHQTFGERMNLGAIHSFGLTNTRRVVCKGRVFHKARRKSMPASGPARESFGDGLRR